MSSGYSCSIITGFRRHLPIQNVTLPLKYPRVLENKSAADAFSESLTASGSLIKLKDKFDSYIQFVSYEILSDMKTIILTPINLQTNELGLVFRSLQISLPHEIIAKDCFSIIYSAPVHESNDDDPFFIVDLIDENFLFISLKIQLSDFIVSQEHNRLSVDNFKSWGNISVPYSFELRSSPFLSKAIDPYNIIVSLKDGGLLHFQRTDLLKDFDVYNFTDASSLFNLNIFGGILKKGETNLESLIGGISSDAVIDLIALDSSFIVTYSVSKILRFWNIKTHEQICKSIDLSKLNSSQAIPTTVPTKYLNVFQNRNTGKKYLALPIAGSVMNEKNNSRSGFTFKIWEINFHSHHFEAVEIQSLNFLPIRPKLPTYNEQEDQNQHSIWLIQDYLVKFEEDRIKFHILWKSNISSVVSTYDVVFPSGSITSVMWSELNLSGSLAEIAPYHEIEYYRDMILSSGRYDDMVVITSLNIFREHATLSPSVRGESIRNLVIETINAISKENLLDLRSCWFRLFSLCEEFKKLSDESLSFVDVDSKFLVSLHANGIGIFRKSHYYEEYLRVENSKDKLAKILNRLSLILSTKTYYKILQSIKGIQKLTVESSAELYDTYLYKKITDEEVKAIMNEMETIPNAMDIMSLLINRPLKETGLGPFSSHEDDLEIFTKLCTITSFKNIKHQHQFILLGLFILILICEPSDQILSLSNQIIEKISSFGLIESIFDTGFAPSYSKQPPCNKLENSLFWTGIVDKNEELKRLISDLKINEAYDYFNSSIISKGDKFVVDVSLDLIKHGEGKLIQEKFFARLHQNETIERFLIGLVYLINNEPAKFFEIFDEYEAFDMNNRIIRDRVSDLLDSDNRIKEFLDTFLADEIDESLKKANYFHALSTLCRSQVKYNRVHSNSLTDFISPEEDTQSIEKDFILRALKFEEKAIKSLRLTKNFDERVEKMVDQYYLNILDMSLNLSNYKMVYDALYNLDISKFKGNYDYFKLFTKFISHLISNHAISELFHKDKRFLYQKHYLLIDSILLELANGELTLSNSLRCYEFLYSWRLFGCSIQMDSEHLADKRGAVEALYMFITRFKFEKSNLLTNTTTTVEDIKEYKLKILELYLVILNCLKSFENDEDKWLIKSIDSESLSIMKLDDLSTEYFEWLKELELELNGSLE
ncbi:uncharacterized protein PRCAT00001280001 [Priceomyces carsonii]|uniref:uncharacterized protein n=1 Tax=Priceomyces carsonii TaxID=28549 RepID=UPI002EDA3B42|nr:unnamed protein product [Priceomyces carsonii]